MMTSHSFAVPWANVSQPVDSSKEAQLFLNQSVVWRITDAVLHVGK